MIINIALIKDYLPFLLQGAYKTIQLALLGATGGLIGGTLLAIIQTSRLTLFRWVVTLFVMIIRGTPMLIQIAFLYYGIFPALGFELNAFTAGAFALGINSSAYVSQIMRSGIQSVNRGQIEAAKTLGFSTTQIMRYIILPQAFRVVIPALGNEFITLTKDSSLTYTIGVVELYKQSIGMMTVTYDPITTYIAIASLYLIMTSTLTFIVSYLERKNRRHA